MNVKRLATLLVVMAALAAWLAGAATSNRPRRPPMVIEPAAVDARGAELANEIARLHDRLRPTTAPTPPGRNVFAFRARAAAAPAPTSAPSRPIIVEPPPVPPGPSFKLVGIAEDDGPDGPIRTAFISSDGQLLMVKEGERIANRYDVTHITPDVVELTDVADNTVRRFALR